MMLLSPNPFTIAFLAWCGCCLHFACGELESSEPTVDDNVSIDENKKYKIAIIGAGMGGTSTAYFLSELIREKSWHSHFEIEILEQSNKIGGRVKTIDFDGHDFEAGGSIIHERNRYASHFRDLFGLKKRPDSKKDNVKTCIFNGRENVFCENSWTYITYMSLLFRYGFDPLHMESRVSKVLEQFERIYAMQKNEQAFEQVHELLAAMGPEILNLTRISYKDLLENQFGFSKRFVNEIAQAITLVNYGQTVSIPAFVGMVSFAGSGSQLWAVQGGNNQIAYELELNARSKMRFNTKVTSVTFLGNHKFRVDSINLDSKSDELKSQSSVYDYVIIATPLTSGSDIRFENFTSRNDLLKNIFDRYQMHQTVATFVKGNPLSNFANKSILSCDIDHEGSFFTSFSPQAPVYISIDEYHERIKKWLAKGESINLYKLFSNTQLKTQDLYTIFDDVKEVREVIWHAYPEFNRINQPFPPFKLRSGVYYLNAIEWAASAIEMSLIGGKNVALLVCHDLGLCGNRNDIVCDGQIENDDPSETSPVRYKKPKADEL